MRKMAAEFRIQGGVLPFLFNFNRVHEYTYDRTARKFAKRENRVAIERDVSVI